MKVIAENERENRILKGVCALLTDLGLDVEGRTTQESAALTFWTVRDLPNEIPPSERERLLAAIEEDLYAAMIIAGFETIEQGIAKQVDKQTHANQ